VRSLKVGMLVRAWSRPSSHNFFIYLKLFFSACHSMWVFHTLLFFILNKYFDFLRSTGLDGWFV